MEKHINNKLIVVSSLTGTDKALILNQASRLEKPVPSKSSSEYPLFVERFSNSPANVVTTIVKFLQNKANWNINSLDNYQSYLNLFNGAPFVSGYASGVDPLSITVQGALGALTELLSMASVPLGQQTSTIEKFDLEKWLPKDSESPKNLSLITQTLTSSDGLLSLTFVNFSGSFKMMRPGLKIRKPHRRSYQIEGKKSVVTLNIRGAQYFQANSEAYLNLGLTNVIDWESSTSTKPVISDQKESS